MVVALQAFFSVSSLNDIAKKTCMINTILNYGMLNTINSCNQITKLHAAVGWLLICYAVDV